jgi:uncharacterized protein
MLNLSLADLTRGPVRIQEQVPVDHPFWDGAEMTPTKPLRIDLEASSVGEGVLVRGEIEVELAATCRRCLTPVQLRLRDHVDLLFEDLDPEEATDLDGEIYPLPDRGTELYIGDAVREQLVLRVPQFVVCAESCRGLCPTCGADLNVTSCDCVPESGPGPWDALKKITFD